MSVTDRIKRYKTTGAGAGLVRVEVLVSAEDRPAVLKHAAELRDRRRNAPLHVAAPVNQERVNDRAKLILHRLIARIIRKDPKLIEEARQKLASVAAPVPEYVQAWRQILELPPLAIAREIGIRTERMNRLRTASPFSAPPGLQDIDTRRRVWKKAKLGVKA
jgi:hypothetical protein